MDDPVLHITFGGNEDQQNAFLGKSKELDMAEAAAAPRRDYHPGKTGKF